MAVLSDLANLTGASWRDAKKRAGVKGASFFDTSGGKAVADKIDAFHKARLDFAAHENKATGDKYFMAADSLEKALTVTKNDRTFTSALAKDMQADIGKLIAEVHKEKLDIAQKLLNPETSKDLKVARGKEVHNTLADALPFVNKK